MRLKKRIFTTLLLLSSANCTLASNQNIDVGDIFVLGGSAQKINSTQVQLTPPSGYQVGTAFSKIRLSLLENFNFQYKIYLGVLNGADGMTFALHNDPRGPLTKGGAGGGLGIFGVSNILAIRYDTYQNSGDLSNRYTSVYASNSSGANIIGSNTSVNFSTNLFDTAVYQNGSLSGTSNFHPATLSWNASTYTLTHQLDNGTGNLVTMFSGSLGSNFANDFFGGASSVYMGFTAATGGLVNLQQFMWGNLQGLTPITLQPIPSQIVLPNSPINITPAISYVTPVPNTLYSSPNLPDGLTINPTSGVISGTLTTPGNYTISVQAQDQNITSNVDTTNVVIAIPSSGSWIDLSSVTPAGLSLALTKPYDGQTTYTPGWGFLGNWTSSSNNIQLQNGNSLLTSLTSSSSAVGLQTLVPFTLRNGSKSISVTGTINITSTFDVGDVFVLNGSAQRITSNQVQLTPGLMNQAGSAFSKIRISLLENFLFDYAVYIGAPNADAQGNFVTPSLGVYTSQFARMRGDGMAFTLHNDPKGPFAVGEFAWGLGSLGIKNSLVVQYDTFQNTGQPQIGDPSSHHTQIVVGTQFNANNPNIPQSRNPFYDNPPYNVLGYNSSVDFPLSFFDLHNPPYIYAQDAGLSCFRKCSVSWNSSTYTLSHQIEDTNVGNGSMRTVFNNSLGANFKNDFFGGSSSVYMGFTGGCGGAHNLQQFMWGNLQGITPITLQPLPSQIVLPNSPINLTPKISYLTPVPNTLYSSPNLPDGLTIDPTSGVISGTLTTPGTYTISIQAQDQNITSNVDTTNVVLAIPSNGSWVDLSSMTNAGLNLTLTKTYDGQTTYTPGWGFLGSWTSSSNNIQLQNGNSLLTSLTSSSSAVGLQTLVTFTLRNGSQSVPITGTINITPAPLTLIANNLTIGQSDPLPSNFMCTGQGLGLGDTVATITTGALSSTPPLFRDLTDNISFFIPGTYPITQGTLALTNSNYTMTFQPGVLTVESDQPYSLPLSLSKIYDGTSTYSTNTLLQGLWTSTANNVSQSNDNTTITFVTHDTINVGQANLTPFTLTNTDGNTVTVGGTLSITPAPLTVTANALNIHQTDLLPSLSYTPSGLVNGDTLTGSLTVKPDTIDVLTLNKSLYIPGTYPITQGSLSGGPNYTITFVSSLLTVLQDQEYGLQLDLTKTYNNTTTYNPQIEIGGLWTSSLSNVAQKSGNTILTSVDHPLKKVSLQNISPFTLTRGNQVTVGGTITITPKTLPIVASPIVMGQKDPLPPLTYNAMDLDSSSSITGALSVTPAQFTDPITNTSFYIPGRYPISLGSLNAGENYQINFTPSYVTVNTDNAYGWPLSFSKAYDGTMRYMLNATLPGLWTSTLQNTTQSNGNTLLQFLNYEDSSVGDQSITPFTLSNGTNELTVGGNVTITPRPLTITASNVTYPQNQAITLTYTTNGLITGDILTGKLIADAPSLTTQAGNLIVSQVGTYSILQGSLKANPNYTITFQKGDLTITPSPTSTLPPPSSPLWSTLKPLLEKNPKAPQLKNYVTQYEPYFGPLKPSKEDKNKPCPCHCACFVCKPFCKILKE